MSLSYALLSKRMRVERQHSSQSPLVHLRGTQYEGNSIHPSDCVVFGVTENSEGYIKWVSILQGNFSISISQFSFPILDRKHRVTIKCASNGYNTNLRLVLDTPQSFLSTSFRGTAETTRRNKHFYGS